MIPKYLTLDTMPDDYRDEEINCFLVFWSGMEKVLNTNNQYMLEPVKGVCGVNTPQVFVNQEQTLNHLRSNEVVSPSIENVIPVTIDEFDEFHRTTTEEEDHQA